MKMRLDQALVARGLVSTRSKAQDLIRRGAVRLDGRIVRKTGLEVEPDQSLQTIENKQYVARSAFKLAAALDYFGLSCEGKTCLDVGASTGGFTEILLERGAARIFAVDVGRDQLHKTLRSNSKVVPMEGTDARTLSPKSLDARIDAITCDVSFISLLKVLPAILPLAEQDAWLVALVKPQFEVGRALIGKGGIVRDRQAAAEAVSRIEAHIRAAGWHIFGALESPIAGRDGNKETLLAARRES